MLHTMTLLEWCRILIAKAELALNIKTGVLDLIILYSMK